MRFNKKLKVIFLLGINLLIIQISYLSNLTSHNINYEPIETDNYKPKPSIIQREFLINADPPENEDWKSTKNNDYWILPDDYGIDSDGCYVSHEWDESFNISRNIASIRWERNFSLVEDMSHCNITSASVGAIVNATVHANDGSIAGIDCPGDSVDQGSMFDYVRFYIIISDLEKVLNEYEIANFQTNVLGNDTAGTYDFLSDTYMNTVSQAALIFYLRKVLETDNHNFTVIMGIDIFCEDNYVLNDIDYWDILRIKSLILTFTYEIQSINVNEPKSGQVFGATPPVFNISVNDPKLDTIWYSLDDGLTNITFTGLTGTIDQTEWVKKTEGQVTIRFYANDTFGQLTYTIVLINKDTLDPVITINSPIIGEIFTDLPPEFNLIIDEVNLDTTWYTLDGGNTIIYFSELTGLIDSIAWNNAPIGVVTIIFYARDKAGNEDYKEVSVLKRSIQQELPPVIPGFNIVLLCLTIVIITVSSLKIKKYKVKHL